MTTEPAPLRLSFTPFPELHSERLSLRLVRPEDLHDVFFLRSDPEVLKYIDKKPAGTLQEAADWIEMIRKSVAENQIISWSITLKGSDRLIGNMGLWNLRPEHFRSEIGYVLHPEFWNKGIMSEALGMALDYGFNVMNLHSIDANINPANAASAAVLEKNGFVREGYFRDNYFYNGRFLDTAVYSIINPAHRK